MRIHIPWSGLRLLLICVVAQMARSVSLAQPDPNWLDHDRARPLPPVVTGATPSTAQQVGKAPSDATVLFDGKDLSKWQTREGGPAKWKVANGYMETFRGAGYAITRDAFGDCQLHVEFVTPAPPAGDGQGRGNSGIYLMGKYEIQVLDSYQNTTYPDGQAAAVYGQYPPQVNASRPPGRWQTYDIVFHAPRFDAQGKLLSPARMTVLHNNVLVHDNVTLTGPTAHQQRPPYEAHPDKLPISLQDHGHPVRYRNIWIREL